MGSVIVYGPQRTPRDLHQAFIIGLALALIGLYLFYIMHDIYYLVYLSLPGIGIMLYSFRAYVSGRRRAVWVEESGAIWGFRGAYVPSAKAPSAGLVVVTTLNGFVVLAIAWYLVRGSSDWLGLLVALLIFGGNLVYLSRRFLRDIMASRRAKRTAIRDILLYSDRLRIRTGVNEVLDIPLSEATICIAGLGVHDVFGNRLDTLRIRYAGTTYTFTVPGGVGQEFINALKSVGIDEVHTCNYLGIK